MSEAPETRLNEYDLRAHEIYNDDKLIGRGRRDVNRLYRGSRPIIPTYMLFHSVNLITLPSVPYRT